MIPVSCCHFRAFQTLGVGCVVALVAIIVAIDPHFGVGSDEPVLPQVGEPEPLSPMRQGKPFPLNAQPQNPEMIGPKSTFPHTSTVYRESTHSP